MAMKLTTSKEMLDGKNGETKKFCMEKLVDFGEAIEAKEMVDLVLSSTAVPSTRRIASSPRRRNSRCTIWDTARSTIRSSR